MASLSTLASPEHVKYAKALLAAGARLGLGIRVESVRRTRAWQASHYRLWKAGKWPYPVAKAGSSLHERGLAFDLSSDLGYPGLKRLGAIWKSWGGRWGGDFRDDDPIHFDFGP